jgi:hypothetical protein
MTWLRLADSAQRHRFGRATAVATDTFVGATGHRAVCSISLVTELIWARRMLPRLCRPNAIICATCWVNSHNVGTTGPKHSWLVIRGGCRPIRLARASRVWSTTSTPCATTAFVASLGKGVVGHSMRLHGSGGVASTCTMVSSISRIAASPAAHNAAAVDAGEPLTPTTIRSMTNWCSRRGQFVDGARSPKENGWCAASCVNRLISGEAVHIAKLSVA